MPRSNEVDALILSIVPQVPGAALIAVGGYGRHELFPYSDIDLLLLGKPDKAAAFSPFFRQLWDRGLRVSHSVHTVPDCLKLRPGNVELTLSLIDRRYLSGDLSLWEELDAGFRKLFSKKRAQLESAAAELTRERHSRYQNTIYHLEPNVKDGPGGLRDLHILRWFDGAEGLSEAEATLTGLRRKLHGFFGRDGNVLTFAAQDAIGPSPEAVMASYFRAAREVLSRFKSSPAPPLPAVSNWQEFEPVLVHPDKLRSMHVSGALGRMLPSWAGIEGLALRDYYHQYTVDEHSLVAIENILHLRSGPAGAFADLARDTRRYPLLLMALLLHDTGKGRQTDSHSRASVEAAAPDLEAIGMPSADRELVLFLIGAHLEMSRTMTTRDLSDPQTARYIGELTQTQERLALLTLMTYADISAVNPRALTPWRTTLLWQLYAATADLPAGELSLPVGPGVTLERGEGVWMLALVAPDRPYLLASVAGAISSFGMDIVRAEAYPLDERTACERFTFTDPFHTLDLNPEETRVVTSTVERAAKGLEDVPRLLSRRMRPKARAHEIDIGFDHQVSQTATVLTVTTEDRPGLLYELSLAISSEGCNIEKVLINTEGRRAIDVFYVTASGLKLSAAREEQLSAKIRSAS